MNQIRVNASIVARILGALALLLVMLSIGGQFSKFMLGHANLKGLVQLFYVDEERNIPTYFSTFLILFAAVLLAGIAVLAGKHRMPHVAQWAILSAGFSLMAVDEAFQFHELLIAPTRTLLGGANLGVFYFAWVVPGMALVLVLGLFHWGFLFHLTASTRSRFLLAAGLYLGGALGLELVGGRYAEMYGQERMMYSMIVTVEEGLEMAGLIVFIWALLNHYADRYTDVQVRFGA